jgi:Domain of unknown function DUF29
VTRYEDDVIAWANEQAALLRAGRFADLDMEHVADEIETVGRMEISRFEARVAELMAHLLAWQHLRSERTRSLRDLIGMLRERIERDLRRTPSLAQALADTESWTRAWEDAILASIADAAARRYGLPQVCPWAAPSQIPKACPWTVAQVRDKTFFPE